MTADKSLSARLVTQEAHRIIDQRIPLVVTKDHVVVWPDRAVYAEIQRILAERDEAS